MKRYQVRVNNMWSQPFNTWLLAHEYGKRHVKGFHQIRSYTI